MSERSTIRRSVRRLPVVRDTIDNAYHPVRVSQELGVSVACKRGCAHCCHQLVTVTMPEAIDLYLAIEKNPLALRRVSAAADAQAQLIMRGVTSREWFKRGTRCVFLTAANDCSVYERRPFACRTHMALETAEHCHPDAADPTVKRPDHEDTFPYVYANMAEAAEAADLPVGVIPLPIALQWAAIAWNQGREALRRHLTRAGIPAYSHVEHAAYWAAILEPDLLGAPSI